MFLYCFEIMKDNCTGGWLDTTVSWLIWLVDFEVCLFYCNIMISPFFDYEMTWSWIGHEWEMTLRWLRYDWSLLMIWYSLFDCKINVSLFDCNINYSLYDCNINYSLFYCNIANCEWGSYRRSELLIIRNIET